MSMPSFDVEFEVYCSCGAGLCDQSTGETTRQGGNKVVVQPCDNCLELARSKGYDEGFDHGYTEGFDEGKKVSKGGE